jgi:hypothetical protein
MDPASGPPQSPVLLFALGYYDRRFDLEADDVLAHFRSDPNKHSISLDHPHARKILADLGVVNVRQFSAVLPKAAFGSTSTQDKKE